ncbi:(2Fe-2S)-binding protein [Prolixibacteraceae bacterium JC049]|nr:(2Fe-2S)-binding protein [Prolixibacteraceae bacterium JC049]
MEERLICICNGVTDKEIIETIVQEGIDSFEELQEITGVATGCGRCKLRALDVFNSYLAEKV